MKHIFAIFTALLFFIVELSHAADFKLAAKPVCDAAFFKTSDFVDGLTLAPIAVSKPSP